MLAAISTLISLQQLDTAADAARRRIAEIPSAERELEHRLSAAADSLQQVKARLAGNHRDRQELEKRVAVVDSRLARFDEHKASVKTNQEYTALLHEIETARAEKDALEEQIIGLLEDADRIGVDIADAERALSEARSEVDAAHAVLQADRVALEAEVATLTDERARQATGVDAALMARYEQLLKQRKMLAIAPLNGDICGACHVRLRPAVTQQVRRNTEIITCDSCQRILYAPPKAWADAEPQPS